MRRFTKRIISQPHSPNEDYTWAVLSNGFFLLDQVYLLHTDPKNIDKKLGLDFSFDYRISIPVDLHIFTLGNDCSSQMDTLLYILVGDLYYMLWIADQSSKGPVAQTTYDYVSAQWNDLYQNLRSDDNFSPFLLSHSEDIRIAPMRLSIFIYATYLLDSKLSQSPTQNIPIASLVSQLKKLLAKTGYGIEAHSLWMPFPGALLCCHAVGMRFAETEEKMWFTMQFMKLAHPWLIERWEDSFKTVGLVLSTVRNIKPLRVEES